MVKYIFIKSPDEWATTKQACRDKRVVRLNLFLYLINIYIYIYIYIYTYIYVYTCLQKFCFSNIYRIYILLLSLVHTSDGSGDRSGDGDGDRSGDGDGSGDGRVLTF